MPVKTAFTTPGVTIPYLTVTEYRTSSVAVDTRNLVPGGTQAANDAALAQLIWRASSWINVFCNQDLAATVNVEKKRVFAQRNGDLAVNTDFFPILEVRDLQIGTAPNRMTALTDLTGIDISLKSFVLTGGWGLGTNIGPLQFGATPVYGSGRLFCRYCYVNGWPTTTLAATCAAGAASVSVIDATGVYGGTAAIQSSLSTPPATILTVYDGAFTENLSVAAVTGTGPYTLTLNGVTAFGHTVPVGGPPSSPAPQVSALPAAVKQAAVYLTSIMVKERGAGSITLPENPSYGGTPKSSSKGVMGSDEDMAIASELLQPFRALI